jgi:hypothetical protein
LANEGLYSDYVVRLRDFMQANDRMGTVFSSASSVFRCMQNFGLTQWLLGASSCVFPGALPVIEEMVNQILQSAFLKIVLSVQPSSALSALVKGDAAIAEVFGELVHGGFLTSNVIMSACV